MFKEIVIQTQVIPAFRNLMQIEAMKQGRPAGEVKIEFYLTDEFEVRCKLTDKEGKLVRVVTMEEFIEMF